MSIRMVFAWYDLWVGAFYDRKARRLYILPVPCVGVVIEFKAPRREPAPNLAPVPSGDDQPSGADHV